MPHPIKNLLQAKHPVIMAILNLTPDSFSDGLRGASLKTFLDKAERLIDAGADILDIGGESTRPGAEFVDLEKEKSRVLPFLEQFRKRHADFPISLDTKKYDLAVAAVQYGIHILNDVSFLSDERFVDLANRYNCHLVLMHMRGDSQTMMGLTEYPDGVVNTMRREIESKIDLIKDKGFALDRLILDLGFGFAKTPEQCDELINNLGVWQGYHLPLLLGLSRKRFLQRYTGENAPVERDRISAELAVKACDQGFQIIRVHNVGLTREYFDLKARGKLR